MSVVKYIIKQNKKSVETSSLRQALELVNDFVEKGKSDVQFMFAVVTPDGGAVYTEAFDIGDNIKNVSKILKQLEDINNEIENEIARVQKGIDKAIDCFKNRTGWVYGFVIGECTPKFEKYLEAIDPAFREAVKVELYRRLNEALEERIKSEGFKFHKHVGPFDRILYRNAAIWDY